MRISDWSSDVCSSDLAQAIVPGLVSVSVQFDTPDAGSVVQGEAALRSVPGVRGATTSSLALGGTSVMAVSYLGTVESLRAARSGRGRDRAAYGQDRMSFVMGKRGAVR